MLAGGCAGGELGVFDLDRSVSRQATRIAIGLTAALLLTTLVWDLTRDAGDQWSAKVLLFGIDTYQETLSVAVGKAGVQCRFEPTCSHYAEAVIRRDGALVGAGRSIWRIVRCGPWTAAGTVDQP